MTEPDDYCDLCDLPRSQCVHGMPPPPPKSDVKAPPRPRKRSTPVNRVAAPDQLLNRRWTPVDAFKPLILTVLERAGGELQADDLFLELEIAAEEQLLPGDSQTTPTGELRWHYAARRARLALIDEGVMRKDKPGFWQLARP